MSMSRPRHPAQASAARASGSGEVRPEATSRPWAREQGERSLTRSTTSQAPCTKVGGDRGWRWEFPCAGRGAPSPANPYRGGHPGSKLIGRHLDQPGGTQSVEGASVRRCPQEGAKELGGAQLLGQQLLVEGEVVI